MALMTGRRQKGGRHHLNRGFAQEYSFETEIRYR